MIQPGEVENCRQESSDVQHGRRDVRALGEIISYLATKKKQHDRQPDVNRCSSKVLDFVGRTVSATARELCQVSQNLGSLCKGLTG